GIDAKLGLLLIHLREGAEGEGKIGAIGRGFDGGDDGAGDYLRTIGRGERLARAEGGDEGRAVGLELRRGGGVVGALDGAGEIHAGVDGEGDGMAPAGDEVPAEDHADKRQWENDAFGEATIAAGEMDERPGDENDDRSDGDDHDGGD